jgi:hypothetical protein
MEAMPQLRPLVIGFSLQQHRVQPKLCHVGSVVVVVVVEDKGALGWVSSVLQFTLPLLIPLTASHSLSCLSSVLHSVDTGNVSK